MRITCPACGYRRDIPGRTVPSNAAVATCPKCRHRFSFRAGAGLPDGDNFLLEQNPGQSSGADSPGKSPDNSQDYSQDSSPDNTPGSAPGETREKDIWDHLDERGLSSGSAEGGGNSQDGPPDSGGQTGEETVDPDFEPPHGGWDAPWERLDLHGFFQGFWLTVKGVMFAAPTFFQGLRVGNGIARPLVFYILVMEFEALCQYFWHTMGMGFMADMEGMPESETGMVAGIGMGMLLLLTPLLAVVTIFITSALFHLTLMIVRAETRGFEGTFRAVAYGSAPMVLAVIPVVGAFAGFIWVLVVRVIALKHIHGATYIQIILATVLLITLIALLISLTFKVMVG
jgi:hypothetical protein